MTDAQRPVFVVLAGPNGSGKSSFTPRVIVGEKLDPDAIAKRLNPSNPAAAALKAAREAIAALKSWKQETRSFTYETTLSSNASLKEIDDAKAKGYEVRLYFIALDSASRSARRVAMRVQQGGHDIPTADIARRFELTFENALVAVTKVDRFELIDNHKGDFKSVLLIENNRVVSRETSESPRIQRAIDDVVERLTPTHSQKGNRVPRTFVLVHGAWHGAWCWRRVTDLLTARGHRVFTPTLTGLADRSHLLSGAIDLDTHIADVVNLFRWEDIDDAVLVGHSYAGWVISGAIEQLEQRVSSLVYLDAFVPGHGQRGYDLTNEEMRAAIDGARARGEISRPAPPAAAFGVLAPADIAWVDARMTPQPLGVSLQPITLTGARERVATKLYIRTPAFAQPGFDAALAQCQADPSWRTLVMHGTGHDVMVDKPAELADILDGLHS